MPPEPSPYIRIASADPAVSALARAWTAIVVERRLPYRLAIAVDWICRALGLTRKTVKTNGYLVRVRRLTCDEDFVQNVLLGQEYTPPGFEIRESDVVIDVGGNIGTFALLASRCAPRGRVFTFEPNHANFELLQQNISLNHATNIVAVRAALVGTPQANQLKLLCSSEGGFHSVFEDRVSATTGYEMVDALTLKAVFDQHDLSRCDFLKLDCEGAEYDILYNLPKEYLARIEKIAMEYHGDKDPQKRREKSNPLASYLEEVGFRIVAYQEFVGHGGGFIRAVRNSSQPARSGAA